MVQMYNSAKRLTEKYSSEGHALAQLILREFQQEKIATALAQ